jgi:hypothetical protein
MSSNNPTTRESRKGVIDPGNPKRWRNAAQVIAASARKRRRLLRKRMKNLAGWSAWIARKMENHHGQ